MAKQAAKTKAATPKKPARKKVDLGEFLEEIRARAHEIFEQRTRDGISGDDLSDWLQAEAEIKKKYKIT
ncbi:MAG: DUF2934 domain-containing protein [Deltaproteobacteria bacterium]|nr:DUF2934 domain-containing protein [Candidatus Zymogenaceae bacterium]